MMLDDTVLLLVYYYHQADLHDPVLGHIMRQNCPAYLPFDLYLEEPLRRLFSRVLVYDYTRRRAGIGLGAMNREVLEIVDRERPKYVLWTSFFDDVQASTLQAIRQRGPEVIGWFFDDEWRFESYSRHWVPYLDCCVTNSAAAVPRYQALHARVIHTIPNTGVAVVRSPGSRQARYDVSFVGSARLADRQQYLQAMRRAGADISVFGEGTTGYVPLQDMLDIFRTSKINLNFSRTGPSGSRRQIKGRVFQVCLAGGFMLTEYAPGIEDYFEIGNEIACFEDPADMMDRIRYYLTHEEERCRMALAGWRKAARKYTSGHMVARVFREIENGTAGTGGRGDATGTVRDGMPLPARIVLSQYHCQWGRALMEANRPAALWKESLAASLSYNRLQLAAWYYRLVGLLPRPMRTLPLVMYRTTSRLARWWLARGRSAPGVRTLLRRSALIFE